MPGLPPRLYEDEDLIAFDKPSGLLVAPDRWDKERENLMDLVHARLGPEVANLHRIDAPTSGILLCARHREALVKLAGVWEGLGVKKAYTAIVLGAPPAPEHWVDLPIGEDGRRPGLMRVDKGGGKQARTFFRTIESILGYTVLHCEPQTGRTHQIRVHCSYSGFPIVADPHYGKAGPILLSQVKPRYKYKRGEEEKPLLGRLALHAHRLEFPHPRTGAPTVIESPPPKEFAVALKYLRRYA